MKTAVIIVAGGSGLRAGGELPKQYQTVGGQAVFAHTLAAFCNHPQIDHVQPVIGAGHEELFQNACAGKADRPAVIGGATRQASVKAGLDALAAIAPDVVLIHDAARPFVSADIVSTTLKALETADGAIPVLPVVDTIKRVSAGMVAGTVDRSELRAAQTPQGFHYAAICKAHAAAAAQSAADFTDDASIGEWAGLKIAMVGGSPDNLKLTTQQDIAEANERMKMGQTNPLDDIRIGQGYDVHAFDEGDAVILCGVTVPHDKKLKGHSDADVGMHALTDAILGALAEGDIGKHFPPSDPHWKGAASDIFLKAAVKMVTDRGGIIAHGDVTLICEEPKIGPHVDAMRDALSGIMAIDRGRMSVKATTSERLGFTGRREGIAALAKRNRQAAFMSEHIFSRDLVIAAKDVLDICRDMGWKLATAELCTGGLIAAVLTEVAGSSDVVDRGFVTYSNEAKSELLGVSEDLIRSDGAVSERVARAMAEGALERSNASIAVSCTGVAGPGGGTLEKPVGLVHMAGARVGLATYHERCLFEDTGRGGIRQATVMTAFEIIKSMASRPMTA